MTAIVAKGSSFRVRFSGRVSSQFTGDALLDGANLSTSIFVSNQTSLVFENNSGSERTGFLCAEYV